VERGGYCLIRRSRVRASRVVIATLLTLVWGASAYGALSAEASFLPEAEPMGEPPEARAEGAVQDGRPRVRARLLQHPDDTGSTIRVGLLLELAPGWHVYWKNPGETGLPTTARLRAAGARVAPVAWPAPSLFREGEDAIVAFGYEDRALLSSEVALAPGSGSPPRLTVELDLLICRDECIPAHLELERTLRPAPPASAEQRERLRAVFADQAQRLPRAPASLGLELEAQTAGSAVEPGGRFEGRIEIRCAAGAPDPALCEGGDSRIAEVLFFPDPPAGLALDVPRGATPTGSEGRASVTFSGVASREAPPHERRLRGVLRLTAREGSVRHLAVDLALDPAALGAAVGAGDSAAPGSGIGLIHVLALALLGGLVLNLMPCVLPVLAIKAFSVAEMAQRSRGELLSHGLAYTAGILASMSALGIAVVLLRAAGTQVGWGFQFQEPLFVATVSAVLIAFAMNLFGVFEIELGTGALAGVGADATGARRSFFEGLLAVVLATPCSAPFLGTAVGFAFASSPAVILAVFLAVGLGLAAPYALISAIPGLARCIPRAGAWMLHVRAGLGFALLGSVVWLLWVVGRSGGVEAMAGLLAFLLLVAFGIWLFGLAQSARRSRARIAIALGLLALAIGGLDVVTLEPVAGGAERGARDVALDAKPFEREQVAAQLAAGQPVFVYFTADWCITCKVNEHRVLRDPRVGAALAEQGFATFSGDWTRRDETIRQELARFGRAGVPLYLVYRPEAPDAPELLPELLSVEGVLAALRGASARSPIPASL